MIPTRSFGLLVPIALAITFSACSSSPKSESADEATSQKEAPAGTTAKAEAAEVTAPKTERAKAAGRIECSTDGDQRWIEVRANGEGCETAYFKFGKEDIVATAVKGSEHCESIRDRIQKNLSSAGFRCTE